MTVPAPYEPRPAEMHAQAARSVAIRRTRCAHTAAEPRMTAALTAKSQNTEKPGSDRTPGIRDTTYAAAAARTAARAT